MVTIDSEELTVDDIVARACQSSDSKTVAAVHQAVSMAARLAQHSSSKASHSCADTEPNASTQYESTTVDGQTAGLASTAEIEQNDFEAKLITTELVQGTSREMNFTIRDIAASDHASGTHPATVGSDDLKALLESTKLRIVDASAPAHEPITAAHSLEVAADRLTPLLVAQQLAGGQQRSLSDFIKERRVNVASAMEKMMASQRVTSRLDPKGHVDDVDKLLHRVNHVLEVRYDGIKSADPTSRAGSARRRRRCASATSRRTKGVAAKKKVGGCVRPQTALSKRIPSRVWGDANIPESLKEPESCLKLNTSLCRPSTAPVKRCVPIRPATAGSRRAKQPKSPRLPFPKQFKTNPNLSCAVVEDLKLFETRVPTLADAVAKRVSGDARPLPKELVSRMKEVLCPKSPRSRRPMGSTRQCAAIEQSVIGKKNIYICYPSPSSTALCNTRPIKDDVFLEGIRNTARRNGLSQDVVRRMYNRLAMVVGDKDGGFDGTFDKARFFKVLKYYNITDTELGLRMFQVVDSHKNGYFSLDQLVQILCDSSTAPRARQLELLFQIIDLDGGGFLGILELFQFVLSRMRNVQRETESGINKTLPKDKNEKEVNKGDLLRFVKRVFAAIDGDGGGDIDVDEFVEVISVRDDLWEAFQAMNPFQSMMRVRPLDINLNDREQERQEEGFYEADDEDLQQLSDAEHAANQVRTEEAKAKAKSDRIAAKAAESKSLTDAQDACREEQAEEEAERRKELAIGRAAPTAPIQSTTIPMPKEKKKVVTNAESSPIPFRTNSTLADGQMRGERSLGKRLP